MPVYRLSIPTKTGWTFIYLKNNNGSKEQYDHISYDPDSGEPEEIILHGSGWSIEFEDEIDVMVLR